MIHIYNKGNNDNTLLLLHGTGGNENDLLDIGKLIDSNANVLSVRGNILENGMPRFFKRLKEGVFDLDDLEFRTKELNEFVEKMSKEYGFKRDKVIAIGYSNGANIAGSLLFQIANSLAGAILLRPMVPRRDFKLPNLDGSKVFISAGLYDSICPKDESIELDNLLRKAKAEVHLNWVDANHRLTYNELEVARDWYNNNFKKES
ncbi:MAG: alpha/beta hydrolase [Bacilli bacterium]|nr:alpha/beta hydrolase [Bacilli bacterium]